MYTVHCIRVSYIHLKCTNTFEIFYGFERDRQFLEACIVQHRGSKGRYPFFSFKGKGELEEQNISAPA